MGSTLYDTDYYAWTQEQAERLRLMTGDNRIDAAHLAEEVEDLGRSEFYAAASFVELILQHFLKIEFSGLHDPLDHWGNEIGIFRLRLEERLTPTLRGKIAATLDRRYALARREAVKALGDVGRLRARVPETCPYTLDQVLDEAWLPEPRPEP